jgi:sterol desaturase/sphingolipid hydroxylase (fatty acid hydroxylase superfamily)
MIGSREFVGSLLIVLLLLVIGLGSLLWPNGIRAYTLRNLEKHAIAARVNPFRTWMESEQYIWSLRIVGLLSAGMAILIVIVLIRHSR